jgi:hypothetical protein
MSIGGSNQPEGQLTRVSRYDTNERKWYSDVSRTNEARDESSAILLPDGRILVAGGNHFTKGPIDSVEIYSMITNTWSTEPLYTLPSPRSAFAMCLFDDHILIAGMHYTSNMYRCISTYN